MQIGRKIYWDRLAGNPLVDTGELVGEVRSTTYEEDIQTYNMLAERAPDTIGVIELEYGQYAQDFTECNGYRVNLETLALEFSYPDPNLPPEEPVYQAPLSEQTKMLETRVSATEDAILALMDMNLM